MVLCYLADGQSIHTHRWCKYFSSLGHEVHLITFRNTEIEGVKVHFVDSGNISVGGMNWKVLLKANKVRQIIKNIKPDILHAQYATSYGLIGALSGFHPYIVTALGSDVLISPQNSILYRLLLKCVFSKAQWITAMADHMRDAIIKLGANENKVETVMFGIDPSIFNRNNRTLSEHKFVITSTRNFEKVYNIPLLIYAISELGNDLKEKLEVNLIGEGTERQVIESLVSQLGLSAIVRFYGRIPQPEIASVLNKTHLFVSVSLSDGNNVSLNEAMACGAISIASDIPANKQWIAEGVNGYIVPTDDAKLLADRITYVYTHYDAMQNKAIEYNDKIIREKALWTVNMNKVLSQYNKLSNKSE